MKKLISILTMFFSLLGSSVVMADNPMPLDTSYTSDGSTATVTITNSNKADTLSWHGSFLLPAGETLGSIWSVANVTSKSTTEGTLVNVENPAWSGGGVIHAGDKTTFGFNVDGGAVINNLQFTAEGQTPPGPPISGPGFPAHTFAPYVDILAYPMFKLTDDYDVSSQKYYTLAFIVADGNGNPSWGGMVPLSDFYYADQITKIRQLGGDIIISFGGANGTTLAQSINDVNQLADAYSKVIDDYQLTRIDFDVEGAALADSKSVDRRNKALALLEKKYPHLEVAYCLPILPTGLTSDGLNVLNNAVSNQARVDVVNAMSMDFGYAVPKMGDAIIESLNSLIGQLKTIYTNKSEDDLWKMIGVTPMIGENDSQNETVSLSDAAQIEEFAKSKQMNLVAMWSSGRDKSCSSGLNASPSCSGITQNPYDFTKTFFRFSSN